MKTLRSISLLLLLGPSCTNAQNTSLQVSYNLPTSDQLGSGAAGAACTCAAATTAQAAYLASGVLELDPILNANAQYTLNLQTENYLDTSSLTDSNGTTISGPQRNEFHVHGALVDYLDTKGVLPDVGQQTILVSADVRPGGLQSAACVPAQAVPNAIAQQWYTAMKNANPPVKEDVVVLQVQLYGVLGSGESITTGYFHFPITICTNCAGANYDNAGKCFLTRTTLVGEGHGPCCAPQDFTVTCERCGGAGEPCCTDNMPCDTGLKCVEVVSTTIEFCPPYNNALQTTCATTM
jgi:hypothetical protein